MKRSYQRKEFIQLLSALGAGWVLSSCDQHPVNSQQTVSKDTLPQKADEAIEQFNSGNAVYVKRDNEQYDTLRRGFNKRIEKYPAVIAVCKNTDGVTEAIRYARKNKLKVAVKSGGHSIEGFCVNDGGLVVYLGLMNKIEWVHETYVKLQPACRLADIHNELLPKGKLIPSGSCGSVGIGGLALGGGYGFFCRSMGLTCDSLQEVTIVDGYGQIHSSRHDRDLLWACRGGGNGNFGIVTEMVFVTHTAPKTFTSHRFKSFKVDVPRAKNLLERWFAITADLQETCCSAFVLNGKTIMILVTNFGEHSPELQKKLDDLSALSDKTALGNPHSLAGALKPFYGADHPVYFRNACAGMYNGFESVAACIEDVMEKVTTTPGMIYQVNTFGGKVKDTELGKASCR